jgi:hypothetical protein
MKPTNLQLVWKLIMVGALTLLPIYLQGILTFCYTKSCSRFTLVFRRFLIQILAGLLVILTQVFIVFLNCFRLMLDICLTKTDLGCVKTYQQKSHSLLCAWWDTWCLNFTCSSKWLVISFVEKRVNMEYNYLFQHHYNCCFCSCHMLLLLILLCAVQKS